jgi:hypothetical protein
MGTSRVTYKFYAFSTNQGIPNDGYLEYRSYCPFFYNENYGLPMSLTFKDALDQLVFEGKPESSARESLKVFSIILSSSAD